jgi:hypothetical protein
MAVRQQPFDASVGSDASGAAAVVFSRCVSAPAMASTGGETQGGELVKPLTGSGCRIHMLLLNGGTERAIPIHAPTRASDTTPSIWRGVVTFARRAPGHGNVMQVLSWSPKAPRRLTALAHGAIPLQCPNREAGCRQSPVEGEVRALASDGAIVAFVWTVFGGRPGPEGDQELRIDRADGHGTTIADGEVGGEACMGPVGHHLERVSFESPFVSAQTASFGELYDFGCFTGFAGVLVTHGAAPGYASRGKLEGVSLAVASDEGRLYGLVGPDSEASVPVPGLSWTLTDGPYCSSASPCTIEPLPAPALKRDRRLPFEPVAFYGR